MKRGRGNFQKDNLDDNWKKIQYPYNHKMEHQPELIQGEKKQTNEHTVI